MIMIGLEEPDQNCTSTSERTGSLEDGNAFDDLIWTAIIRLEGLHE
jgi:hypothetical protein